MDVPPAVLSMSRATPCDTLGIRKAAEPLRSNGANAEPGVARPAKFSPGAPCYVLVFFN